MAGYLSTHILDTAQGCPAKGIRIALFRLSAGGREQVADAVTNDDGRTDAPILAAADFQTGTYELVFYCGAYLKDAGLVSDDPLFLDEIPLRFGMSDPEAHYHVPLLLSPYGYSTYRGS